MILHTNAGLSLGSSYASTFAPASGLIVQGDVGIGTDNPSEKLDIVGNVKIQSTGNVSLLINADTDNSNENDHPEIKFIQDGAHHMLSVGSEGAAGNTYTGTSANSAYIISGSGHGGSVPLLLGTNNKVDVTILSNGKVGIGCTPISVLSIKNASNAYIEVAGNNNTPGASSMLFGQNSSNVGYCWNRANKELLFGTNNLEAIRIDSSGNVGIGGLNPSAKLHVRKTDVTSYIDNYSTAVIEDTEARLQLCSSNAGSNAAAITLSNDSHHWSIHHRGSSSTNKFCIGYANTTSTADLVNNTMASPALTINTSGLVEIPHLHVDKSYTYLDNATITGTFVSGAAPNTWHSITNLGNIGNGLGGGYGGETIGLWVRIFWTSGSTSAGYNHNLVCFIPPGTSNTHSTYSGSSFETSHIGGVSYTEGLAFTVKHHTSTPGGHDLRLRLFNDGASGSGLNLQIYTQTSVGSSNAKITVWRAS